MTFSDWVAESRARFQTLPAHKAARKSAFKFGRGALRRTLPRVTRPVWDIGDWDVLVILDACRADQLDAVIEEYDELPDDFETVWSPASCSIQWINHTFNMHSDRAENAGYITGNPFADHDAETAQSADLSEQDLECFVPLYRTHWEEIKPGISTVPPEAVTDHAIRSWRDVEMDRLVLHYMQPHEPYRSRPEWGSGDHKLLENMVYDDAKDAGSSIWPQVKAGDVPEDELWEAGVDNLRWALDDITERLLPNIDGRVAISADHGNAMGEWGEWHHPSGAIAPTVRKVPWMEVDCTDQETIDPDITRGAAAVDGPDTGEQLEALGYV